MSDSDEGSWNLGNLEANAERALPADVWAYVSAGASEEDALRGNRDAFRRRTLRPRRLTDVTSIDTTTNLLDEPVHAPFFVSPMARHGLVHPEAEPAVARAAASRRVLAVFSTLSTRSVEEIAGASGPGPRWFQLYLQPDFAQSRALVERAERSGYSALVLTVDLPILAPRDRWLAHGPVISFDAPVGNGPGIVAPARSPEGQLGRYRFRAETAATWTILDDLQSITRLPVIVKGILTGDDARRALTHGARAVIVSNHGGRQLNSAEAALDALPEVVRSVGSDLEVYVDSGVRRASDVLTALAMGARGVGIGRPVLWALALGGEAGVARLFDLLGAELATEMALLGRRRISEIDRSLLGSPRW
jgi:4-hydroxymandelate oxidase